VLRPTAATAAPTRHSVAPTNTRPSSEPDTKRARGGHQASSETKR
jgi:hypothetical protein